MSHLSLYRKFRPDTFDKMVRQEHVVRILKNQIAGDLVGHAYLFTGPRGTGKTSVARIFARAVNCERPQNGSPCGKCETCLAVERGTLDIVEIDAASNNGVNEMRDLREKVQYPPVTGRYKVYIIDEVHMLTDSAFNALLKTLEEPPRHAIFILATTEPQKIPATILSRCMRLDFKLIPTEDLENHLKSILHDLKKSYEDAAVAAIARAGAGSDRDMLSIAEMCLSYGDKLTYEGVSAALGSADFEEIATLVGKILDCDLKSAFEHTESILSEGKAVGVLCKDVLSMLNRVSVVKACGQNAQKLLSLPELLFGHVQKIAERADGHTVLRATEIFAKTETELKYVSSPRISLETAIMRACMPEQDYDIEALLTRIALLEKQIAEGGTVAQKAEAETKPPQKRKKEERKEDYPPPLEEPDFGDGFFGLPPTEEQVFAPKIEESKKEVKETESPLQAAPAADTMTAQVAFGKFIRTLRKTSSNGVLRTLCDDLEAEYEGNTLALYTESKNIYASLSREEHKKTMAETFSLIGITDFAVKLKGEQVESRANGIEKLKQDFSDYPVEMK